jgi:hypothetical protein
MLSAIQVWQMLMRPRKCEQREPKESKNFNKWHNREKVNKKSGGFMRCTYCKEEKTKEVKNE